MKTKHWIAFIALGGIWSSSFLWIKIGVQEASPNVLVAFRMLFGAIMATAIAVYQKSEWPTDRKTLINFAILGPTSLAIPIFFISWGEQIIDSAVASILNATVPLFTLIIAHFWLHDDKITRQKVTGLLTGFAGILILFSKDLLASQHQNVIGQLAVILAALFYAWSAVFGRKTTQHIKGMSRAALPVITAAIFMWITIPFTEKPLALPHLPITWIAFLWLGLLGSGITSLLFYYLLHEIGPTRTTLVTYIFPVGGVLLGVIFLKETLTWQLIAGTILIIMSLIIVNNQKKAA